MELEGALYLHWIVDHVLAMMQDLGARAEETWLDPSGLFAKRTPPKETCWQPKDYAVNWFFSFIMWFVALFDISTSA